jgi:hypothetical protein
MILEAVAEAEGSTASDEHNVGFVFWIKNEYHCINFLRMLSFLPYDLGVRSSIRG